MNYTQEHIKYWSNQKALAELTIKQNKEMLSLINIILESYNNCDIQEIKNLYGDEKTIIETRKELTTIMNESKERLIYIESQLRLIHNVRVDSLKPSKN